VFRNREGEEFLKRYFPETAEKSTRSEVILAMAKEIHAGRAGTTGGIFMDATKVPEEIIQKQIPHVFKTCLHRGIDIRTTPLEVAPGSHTWLGGLKIGTEGNTPVPGLWAAGETAGGIHGGNRIGGSALSASLVFGRRAGQAAAAAARSSTADPAKVAIPEVDRAWLSGLLERSDGPLQGDLRRRCRMLAHENLGSIRDAERCAAALGEYERIAREDVPRMRLSDEARTSAKARSLELESALSVRNLALLGRLLATAALNREESRGAHYRLDFPETDEAKWRRVTRLERADSEAIAFHSDPVKDPPA
jgi:succinate dehydrogenase/fumarate reductase flavoprotein subunit